MRIQVTIGRTLDDNSRSPGGDQSVHHIDAASEAYTLRLVEAAYGDPVLEEMEARAEAEGFPIIGRVEGRMLELQARAVGARRVIELGSGFGYSAYWFARAVGPEGTVICTEESEELVRDAKGYLSRAGLWDRVDYRVADGLEVLSATDEAFDVVYVDTHKFQYPDAWAKARSRIRVGGLYLCDNVLWRSMVPRGEDDSVFPGWPDAIREHNRLVMQDRDWITHLDPTRDGVLVALRLA
jgi:predicted O-methyltransferase YrrM